LSETVVAVHKVTGLIGEVPVHYLDLFPALEKATEKQIKSAQTAREVEAYGAPIKNGEIPEGPVGEPVAESTEGGTA